jgi:hypothetical protein
MTFHQHRQEGRSGNGFAVFFDVFRRYDFYDKQKKRRLPKYILWATCRSECERMSYHGTATMRFRLIKRKKLKPSV